MSRPTEYPLAIQGFTQLESGRIYVAARFALQLLTLLTPWKTEVIKFKPIEIIEEYWRTTTEVNLTSMFAEAEKSEFSRTSHLSYLGNSGHMYATKVIETTAHIAATFWSPEVHRLVMVYDEAYVEQFFKAAAKLIVGANLRMFHLDSNAYVLMNSRLGLPGVKVMPQVIVKIQSIGTIK